MRKFSARGGWWVVGQTVLMLAAFWLGWAIPGSWAGPGTKIVGAAAIALGGGVGLAGARVLGRNLTPFPQPGEGSPLVQRGVYRWVRHPLYLSVVLVLFGWALMRGSAAALGACGALALFLDRKARQEEERLRRSHPGYEAYERRAKRFIPWVYFY